ncbi:MAG TPA: hypothetical protein VIY72_15230 [Acidimicrobiales bacterium]
MDRPPRPSSRRARRRAVVGVMAALVLALVGTAWTPPLVDPPTSGQTFGQGPLEAVTAAATANAGCGLSSVALAALMMAPTYTEAGGPVPAPMALSRYDNVNVNSTNVNLFAFSNPNGPYLNAFWSPGIGMWQFDSAGAWPFGAAGSIDSVTSANQAARTIASRWCNAPDSQKVDAPTRRKYAWGPWYGCSTTNKCEPIFQALAEGSHLNTGFDPSVSRYGGMQQRTCLVAAVSSNPVECWYVNPALAQGSKGWTGGTYTGPTSVTPLPKPFYVVEANGREYRVWIAADTGYDTAILASRPDGRNARTSLTWSSGATLCDTTANRGTCTGPRVAQTPWGPKTGNPFGSLDAVTGRTDRTATVTGWTIDPDTNSAIDVHVYVDGGWGGSARANRNRPDVAEVVPGYGANHGYGLTIGNLTPGVHQVCAFAINRGPYGDTNPQLGCRDVTVPGEPFGNLEDVSAVPGGVRARGWAADPDGDTSIDVHLYVDGALAAVRKASGSRPDVGSVYPWAGAAHGYEVTLPTTGGSHRVCAYGINVGPTGTANTELGCRTATVDGSPLGTLDAADGRPGGVEVRGWAFDPDTGDATVRVRIDGGTPISVATTAVRDDVASAFSGRGATHGFSRLLSVAPGVHQVCATVPNQGANGTGRNLGCRSVTVPGGVPFGNFEGLTRSGSTARLTGWTIDPDVADPVEVHVYVNGAWGGSARADRTRADVGAAFPGYGALHGFDLTLGVPAGRAEVCVYAINVGAGGSNPRLGCRVV